MNSRWMADDAVDLLLKEVDAVWSLVSTAPDPARARALFVGLTLFRFDDTLKRMLEEQLTALRWRDGWTPFASWLTGLMFEVRDDPASWPFCLSEQEFDFHATQSFGGEIGKIEGVYHPPSFYEDLGRDILGIMFGVGLGVLATAAFPEAAAGTALAASLSPPIARGLLSGAGGIVGSHFFGKDPFDAATKSMLWKRYEIDYRRRQLQ